MSRVPPQPRCPVRPGEYCTLCQMGVTGPADCGLVYLVFDDTDFDDADFDSTTPDGEDRAKMGEQQPKSPDQG
nr:hypothetical protein [Propionibacterium sp.]